MYLWSTDSLAKALSNRKVSRREEAHYLTAALLLFAVFLYAPLLPCTDFTIVSALEGIAVAGITIAGIRLCYRANPAGEEEFFLQRFVCLSVPLAIKILVLFWAAHAIFFGVTEPYVQKSPTSEYDWYYRLYEWTTFFVAISALAIFYWRMSHHLRSIKLNDPRL